MARYGLILRLERALWLRIIFKPLLTPQRAIAIQFEFYFGMFVTEKVSMICNVNLLTSELPIDHPLPCHGLMSLMTSDQGKCQRCRNAA